MATITADQVKALRDQTGAGMMECKTALSKSNGDLDAARRFLRESGAASAAKKAGRSASDGLVGVTSNGTGASLVEVNCETDFVARNTKFQEFVRTVSDLASRAQGDIERIKATPYPGNTQTVSEALTGLVATIGENMSLRRAATMTASNGFIASYVHSAVAPGLGKLGVLVELGCANASSPTNSEVAALGEEIAMQIAASSPVCITREEVPADRVAEEKAILEKQIDAKKPPQVREKIVEGKLNAFFEQVCLLDQAYIREPKRKIRDILKEKNAALQENIQVRRFLRFAVGE